MSRTRSPLLAVAVVLTALLAACAGDAGSPTVEVPTPMTDIEATDVDIAFLQGMVPHHAQAVEMAELVEGRTAHPDELGQLAAAIIATQQEEIDQMNDLLVQAGQDPVDPAGDMGGMNHGGMDMGEGAMEGMMSAEDMTSLADAEGDAFDGMFLQMMIAHHEGAISSAQEVLDQTDGGSDAIADLAEAIITAQEAEIAQMQGWQEDWGV